MSDVSELVKRLTKFAFNRAFSSEQNLVCEAADTLTALKEENERLREALVAEREENLWNAFNAGIIRPDGKWITGGMGDAEWLMQQCGGSLRVPQDPEAIKSMIPIAARKAVAALTGKEAGDG